MKRYAEVIIDLASDDLDRPFHYRIPEKMEDQVFSGQRVIVPFGSRRVTGIVIRKLDKAEVEEVRDIEKIIDRTPLLSQEALAIAEWLSEYYYCRLIEALHCFLPPWLDKVREKHLLFIRPRPSFLENQEEILASLARRAPKQAELLDFLRKNKEEIPLREAVRRFQTTSRVVRSLEAKGLVEVYQRCRMRDPTAGIPKVVDRRMPELTGHQRAILQKVSSSLEKNNPPPMLIHGVTGSGKTEVYMQAVEMVLKQGKRALILVPEISLTPQMIELFKGRFGLLLAVLHSRLSLGERHDEWWRIQRGKAKIVLGTRSAVFAPLDSLGIIIIDEEHEISYKQEEAPRYHAREVALRRSEYHGALLLMGSATPSLESYTLARKGKYELVEMPSRVSGRALPPVEIVDMRAELARGNRGIFSRSLYNSLKEVLGRGEQVILFLNRRGFASFTLCRECGWVVYCPFCDVALTFHAVSQSLVCHYCGHEERPPDTCPACGGYRIRLFGIGTQRVEREFIRLFPDIPVIRVDTDTTTRKGAHQRLLQAFKTGKARVMVGTQMITKGLDFPGVTLVGVITADTVLNLPDFRSGERTFQLLTQVAGRAGRGFQKGKVIIQTYNPLHYSIRAAQNHDYFRFYLEEMERRSELGYPPFGDIVRILFHSEREDILEREAERLKDKLFRLFENKPVEVLGPSPAPLHRIKGAGRWQVIIKGPELARYAKDVKILIRDFKVSQKKLPLHIYVDFNPLVVL